MGRLIEGVWRDEWYDTKETDGHFVRHDSSFRDWVEAAPDARYPFSPGRYHLYVSYACPWAHRTLIVRKLKHIEDSIDVSVVHWLMLEEGWTFNDEYPDHINQKQRLHEVYTAADPKYSGRVTVPVLWDRERETIVSNESADIIRMLNSAFDAWTPAAADYWPAELRPEIDAVNERVYANVNNGVYRCGFATTQVAYEEAFVALFETLDWLDGLLGEQRFLAGDRLTEADWRLFTTLVRFDPVYVGHFKANLRRIRDYPRLSNYTRQLYQVPGVAPTVHLGHIKRHYYYSHRMINPTGIVPAGPELDLDAPHDRGPVTL